MEKRLNIILFIRSLGIGGAERQLLILAKGLAERHDVTVMTFYDDQQYEFTDEENTPYRYVTLNKRGRWDTVGFLLRFIKELKRINPDVIYTFMNTASVFGLLVKLFGLDVLVVWGVRSSNVNLALYGLVPRLFRWLECRLSVLADKVISNSYAGRDEAIKSGFADKQFLVIPNGIDANRFVYNEKSRVSIRKKYSIPQEEIVIGIVARHDPMKGIEYFLEAARIHLSDYPNTIFILIGDGDISYSNCLKLMAKDLKVDNNIRWVGKTSDVTPFYSAMDIYTSSSVFGEGFSNTIGEAMSCQLPVVVTDVGDAGYVTGEFGRLVSPRKPDDIASEWSRLLSMNPEDLQQLRASSREWISRQYSIGNMIESTENALISVSVF